MMTFRSNIWAIAAFILLLTLPVFAVQAASPETTALAKNYVATVPVENEVRMAIEQMSLQVPAEQRVLFKQLGEKSIDYNRLRAAAEQAVAETFTDEEIKAMTEFYKSPVGQSVRTKMPEYDKRMQPVMTSIMQDFVKRLQENNVLPNMPAGQ